MNNQKNPYHFRLLNGRLKETLDREVTNELVKVAEIGNIRI